MGYRFHVVSLPHTETSSDWIACAYTQRAVKFARMMTSLGHEVFLYAGERNEAPCTEHITILTRAEQAQIFANGDHTQRYFDITWDRAHPHWTTFNERVIAAIGERAQPRDFLCLTAGHTMLPIAQAFPALTAVEYCVGYDGIFTNHRVFESYGWMHHVLGLRGITDGRNYDCVIPNQFDPADFAIGDPANGGDPYFLYLGRLIGRKGWQVAVEATERLGAKLLLAGQYGDSLPDLPSHVQHVGFADRALRKQLLSNAMAVFVPTTYVGPFEGVHAEALMSGTPVLTTDWGVFPETVQQGIDGYRCRTLQQFVDGAYLCGSLDRELIRARAIGRWSLDEVRWQFAAYFGMLAELWHDGWYELSPENGFNGLIR